MTVWEDKRFIYSDSAPSKADALKLRIAKDRKPPDSEMHPAISFCLEKGTINIGRDVIRMLKYPAYIVLLQSDQRKAIAVVVGDPEDHNAFKVPKGFPEERGTLFRITSKSYAEEMMALHDSVAKDRRNGKLVGPKDKTCSFVGRYDASSNAVIFDL